MVFNIGIEELILAGGNTSQDKRTAFNRIGVTWTVVENTPGLSKNI